MLALFLCFLCSQDCWYCGSVTRYHRRKDRHRVEYDDGDHEWINLGNECDRVQVQQEDGLWTMVSVTMHCFTLNIKPCILFGLRCQNRMTYAATRCKYPYAVQFL